MKFEVTGSFSNNTIQVTLKNKTTSFNKHLELYKKYMINNNLAENTITVYSNVVKNVYHLYDGKITKNNLLSWKSWMIDEKKYKASTINLYIIAFNQYLKFINHPELCLKIIKVPKKNYLDNALSFKAYTKLKSKLLNDNNSLMYHIVSTFAATGVRVSELVKLNAEDVLSGMVDIHSKGDRIRRIYFPKKLIASLKQWLGERTEGPLFCGKDNKRITISAVKSMFARAKKKYNIPGLHCHALRHLFAFTWLDRMSRVKQKTGQRQYGVLPILAEILGHKSLDTVFIYLQPSTEELKAYADRVDW